MNHPLPKPATGPRTPTFDRDALARRIFDEAICPPDSTPAAVLPQWFGIAIGTAGFVSDAVSPPEADVNLFDLSELLFGLQQILMITRTLAAAVEDENSGLRAALETDTEAAT